MKIAGIDFPEEILDALHEGNLVVFAGAGVSIPAGMPSFEELAKEIASGTNEEFKEPIDSFLGDLKRSGTDVHKIAAQNLKNRSQRNLDFHKDIIRLYQNAESVRIVTTNFDLLFEQAVADSEPEIFEAPALPLGKKFNGIVHVHGSIDHPDRMVLTDEDFGKGYLTEGWARRFLVNLFRKNTVLFVGYGHDDTIMNYLTRAEEIQRFALIGREEDSAERWKMLGIDPIWFPQSKEGDYSSLYEGVKKIANMLSRGTLDWKREIREIAEKKPPLEHSEDEKLLLYAMKYVKDVDVISLFTDVARDPGWIKWLDDRKYLDNLFGNYSWDKRDSIFAGWLAKNFCCEHSDIIFRLVTQHDRRLNPKFWYALGLHIEFNDKDILSRWILLLLNTAPKDIANYGYVMLRLGECCNEYGLSYDLLRIFEALLKNSLYIAPEDEGKYHYYLNELWDKHLNPRLEKVAEDLISKLVFQFQETHDAILARDKLGTRWEYLSLGRSAIERHEQDQRHKVFDVLIDGIRDCLDWLSENKMQYSEYWCERFARSDHAILHRLSIHGMSARKDLSADGKIEWLLESFDFHNVHIHHEIFQAMKLSYPDAGQDYRKRVISEVKKYKDEKDKWAAHEHFNWFAWLNRVASDCLLLQQALGDIREKYPGIKASEHPDFAIYMGEPQFISQKSPQNVEELLSKPAAEQLDYLLSYKDERFVDAGSPDIVSRKGLLEEVTKAITKDFGWGIGLVEALSEVEEWNTDLWRSLMHAWAEMDLDEDKYKKILQWMAFTKLQSNHNQEVANVLYSLVKDGGKSYAITLLSQAEELANGLWENLKPGDINENLGDWVLRAINHPAGKLAEFWLGAISVWRGKQEPSPDEPPDNYRKGLSKIVDDQTLHGRLGRTILAGQLHFFSNIDKAWTKKYLFPLFDTNDPDEDYQAVWDGFLTWGRITPVVAEELEEYFLKAIENLENTFANTQQNRSRQNRFIKYYATMINFFVSDPFPEWIPKIFQYGDGNIGHIFAHQVWLILMNLEGKHQERCWENWLKDYWENRLVGKPKSLRPEEIGRMIEWLPHLTEVFPEAVELAVQMPSGSLDHCRIVHELNESNLWKRYPKDVSELLVYLEESKLQGYIFWDELPELVGKLRQQDISEKHKEGLKELLVKLGFPDQ